MKISNNNMSAVSNARVHQNENIKDTAVSLNKAKSTKNFDNILISSINATDTTTDDFVNDLKNKIMSDVKSPASSYKLNDLKSQVALGQYQINISDVAKKILLN